MAEDPSTCSEVKRRNMKVLTSVVNNPLFIEIQYHTLKQYMNCEYEFIVFNDAKPFPDFTNGGDEHLHKTIVETCRRLSIQCIDVPNLHHKHMDCPVQRCSDAMNFMYDFMLQNKDEYLIIDSDMFLIAELQIEEYRKHDCAIVLQSKDTYEHVDYIWNGLFYFNLHKMKHPEIIYWDKSEYTDVGGMADIWLRLNCKNIPGIKNIRYSEKNAFNTEKIHFIKHLWSLTWTNDEMPEHIKNTELAQFIKEDPRNIGDDYFCEIYDDKFLHYRAGGDWNRKGLHFHNDLSNKLKNILVKCPSDGKVKEEFSRNFSLIYENAIWDDVVMNENKSRSGGGSDIDYNVTTYVPFVKRLLIENNIHKVVDIGCGDFLCGPLIYGDLHIEYMGYDIYEKIIQENLHKYDSKYRFKHIDIFYDWTHIESGDVCIIKDVLQHWKLAQIYQFLDNIVSSKKFKYILICNCCNQTEDNPDIHSIGDFRELSAKYYPLKRYGAKIIYTYNTKELSMITCHS